MNYYRQVSGASSVGRTQNQVIGCALLLLAILLSPFESSLSAQRLPTGLVESDANLETVVKHLGILLTSSKLTARIYYSAVCASADGYALPFPRVEVRPPGRGQKDLTRIRELFKADPAVTVSEARPGIVSITIGKPWTEILQTKIPRLTFNDWQRYNPGMAMDAVLESPAVKRAMTKYGTTRPMTLVAEMVTEPAEGLPHLPRTISDTSVDEAFDLVSKTFGVVVIYGACNERGGHHVAKAYFSWPP
jgi:hypothetical protein